MSVSCDKKGVNCKRLSSDTTHSNSNKNTIIGLVLGSVAVLICFTLLILLLYVLYWRRWFRSRFIFRSRKFPRLRNQNLPISVYSGGQQPQIDIQRSSNNLSVPHSSGNVYTIPLDSDIDKSRL